MSSVPEDSAAPDPGPDPDEHLAPGLGELEHVIASRTREYRIAKGLTMTSLAQRVGMSKAMLSKIENAQTSCSLSVLSRLAAALEVPVTALFRGIDSDREAVFTRAGHGAEISRRGSNVNHVYRMLGALRGQHKRIEPLLCTLTEASEVFPLFQHPGTEFLFMLDGVMRYVHGDAQYEMRAGDSLIFDGEGPHGPSELVELPITFITVTGYGHMPGS